MRDYNWTTIEKYYEGDLTPSELAAFKTLIKNGKDFEEVVDLYGDIENSISSRMIHKEEEDDLNSTLKALGNKYVKKEKLEKKSILISLKRYGKYMVAASLVLFATLFYFKNSKGLYEDFAKHPNLDIVVRGNIDVHLVNVQKAFNTKNYALAEQELSIILAKDKDNTKVELQLYLAISLMEQDKFTLADSILEKIEKGNSIYKNKAIWNLGLSKLKQKDFESCKTVLKTLPENAEDYDLAQKLLGKL